MFSRRLSKLKNRLSRRNNASPRRSQIWARFLPRFLELEDRVVPATFYPALTSTSGSLDQVLYTLSTSNPKIPGDIPVKLVTIMNNSPNVVYPILIGANSTEDKTAGQIVRIRVDSHGQNFNALHPPKVVFSVPGAKAEAVVNAAGQITDILIKDGEGGAFGQYTTPPTITFDDSANPNPTKGSGATATAILSTLHVGDPPTSRYDPLDPYNQGYRGYIGEVNVDPSDPNKVVAGLRPWHQVTVQLPLVFWDGARLFFASNGTAELQSATDAGNPMQGAGPWLFQSTAPSYIPAPGTAYSANFPDPATNFANPDGRVLWYHDSNGNFGGPHGFADDTPGQLTEFTIRDKLQVNWAPNMNQDQLDKILNYDVSYVDQLGLPAMMETTDGTASTNPELGTAPYAGIGADLSVPQMQQLINAFTQSTPGVLNSVLGNYFGGLGYDHYVFPSSIPNFQLLPGGFNVFADSALSDSESTYNPLTNDPRFKLASGGSINRVATGDGGASTNGTITVGSNEVTGISAATIAKLAKGMILLNSGTGPGGVGNYFIAGTYITDVIPNANPALNKIILSTPAYFANAGPNENLTFVGSKWSSATGSTDGVAAQITGIDPVAGQYLRPGMLVTGPGITGYNTINTLILTAGQVTGVTLTGPAPGAGSGSAGSPYVFSTGPSSYVADAMIKLWYAWADYYVAQNASLPAQSSTGSTTGTNNLFDNNALVLSGLSPSVVENLKVGMVVTGPNINKNYATAANIAQGGTGYQVNDVLTVLGGTSISPTGPTTLKVVGVNGSGGITGIMVLSGGSYSAIPPGPVSVSGGHGTGATFNLTHANTTIAMKLSSTSVRLSNPVLVSATGTYNFEAPVPLPRSADAPAYGTHQLTFNGSFTPGFGQDPEKFAATIYDVMAAFSHLPPTGSKLSMSAQLLSYCIGASIGEFGGSFGVPVENRQNQIRDQIKSIMRGVSNFEEFKEFGNPAHPFTSQWYPDPKEQLTGALIDGVQTDYNVYNLNPYVFFVHKTLGMNGYGFSVDDDTADVGSLGNHLQIAYGSTAATAPGTTQKLQNLNYYTGGAPYGALQAQGYVDNTTPFGKFYRDRGYTVIVLPTSLVARLVAADANVTGALASDENGLLKPGTRVVNIASSVPDVYGAGKGVVIVTSQGVPPPSTDGPVLQYTFAGFNTLLPVVSSFAPTSGTSGTTVEITGSNFGFTSGTTFVPVILSVTFNGLPVAASDIVVHSASALTVTVPSGATSGKIAVRSAAGTGYSATDFIIGGAVAPTLLSASPSSGSIKTEVTLRGTGFTGVTNVKFNGVSALSFTFVNDTTLKAVVPSFGAAVGNIVVFTSHGDTSASPPVTFTVNPPASIGFSPTSGAVGTPITLTGTGFTGATAVIFNLTPATSFTVVNDTTIHVTVPAGATDGPISVTTPGGTGVSTGSFDVTPGAAPVLSSFSPGTGSAGTPVTLTGTHFLNATGVAFNGVAASFTIVNDTTITTTVPALATTGLIVVTNPHGSSNNATNFIVTAAVFPTITSFSPGSGPVSTPVTITGTGFTGVTEVHFNGVEAQFTFVSDTEIRTHVPSGATTGTISVTNSAGTGFSTTSFVVSGDDVVTLLSGNIIGEKLPVGTLVGALSSTPSGTYTYQLASGGDNASFTIAGNQLLSAAIFNFNVKSQYHITIKTFQSGAEVASNQFTIDVKRASIIVAGDSNGSSKVLVYNAATRDEIARFNAFGPAFKGGVRVATGDVNGDGVADIILGAGNGRAPTVKVVDGTKLTLVDPNGTISDGALLYNFSALAASYTGGIFVAAADLNQDGFADVVVGRGTGQSRVRVFDGQTGNQTANFLAFSPNFDGGVRVAAVGQVGGHHAQVVVGSASEGGRVKVIDATLLGNVQGNGVIADSSLLASFLPYGTSYTQGVFLSVGDVNGDGFADIVTGRAGSPNVRVFDGSTLHAAPFTDPTKLFDFLAYSPTFKGGVRVGIAQINGRAQILMAPGNPGGVPVKIADSSKLGTPGWLLPDNQIADSALIDSFYVLDDDGIFVGG